MSYSLNNKEMGRRLSIARKIAGKGLYEAAKVIGVSGNKLSSVEKGSIALDIKDIDSLAFYYDVCPSRFFAHDAIHTDLVPRFKKLSKTEDKHVFEAAKLLNNLFSAESELENLLNKKHGTNYPKVFDIGNGDVKELAVKHAHSLREFLGLGNKPILDIFSVVENNLGIRLYQRKLEKGSEIMGMFAFDDELGACILLNANYPRPNRVFAAAHELGHFMADRKKIEVLEENDQINSRNERFAVNFSYAFMMPKESFTNTYDRISNGSNGLTKEIVVELANRFHVPVSVCIRQLDEYGLVEGVRNWYNSVGKIKKNEQKELLGDQKYLNRFAAVDDADQHLPNRIGLLVHRALKRELASEGYLSSLLNLGILEIREIYYDIENGSSV